MTDNMYPVMVVPCRRGGIPCLTPEQAKMIFHDNERVISVSIFEASFYANPCKKSGKSFAEFCGLDDFKVIMTVRSPYIGMHSSAPSTDAGISGDHENGRLSFTNDKWSGVVSAVRPNITIPLCDAVSLLDPRGKRRRNAEARSIRWSNFADSVRDRISCELMKPSCATEDNSAYMFVEDLCQNETLEQYSCRLKDASGSGVRRHIMSVAISVPSVIMCLRAGIQLIECSLPWILSEKGIALTFDLNPKSDVLPPRYETQIDLNDDAFATDIRPLVPSCECYTCQKHTRLYIHHLLTVQEMNSNILLVIHNLSHMVQLIRKYRNFGLEDREKLLQWVLSQF